MIGSSGNARRERGATERQAATATERPSVRASTCRYSEGTERTEPVVEVKATLGRKTRSTSKERDVQWALQVGL